MFVKDNVSYKYSIRINYPHQEEDFRILKIASESGEFEQDWVWDYDTTRYAARMSDHIEVFFNNEAAYVAALMVKQTPGHYIPRE